MPNDEGSISVRSLNSRLNRRVSRGNAISRASRSLRTYKNEVRRQKMIVQNANLQEQRLLLITSALRRFLADEHFRTLLRAEGVRDIPEAVASRIPSELMP